MPPSLLLMKAGQLTCLSSASLWALGSPESSKGHCRVQTQQEGAQPLGTPQPPRSPPVGLGHVMAPSLRLRFYCLFTDM